MVEADSHLKQPPPSILDIYKLFEHIAMLSVIMGRSLTQLYPPYVLLSEDFGILGHLWSQNDVITSWLRLTATSNCFFLQYSTYTKCLNTLICCPLTSLEAALNSYTHTTWLRFGIPGNLWSQKDVITS